MMKLFVGAWQIMVKKIKMIKNKRQILTVVISVLVSVCLVAGATYAVTTVGNDVTVGGALAVTGTSTFSGPVTFSATPTGGPGWTTAFNTNISSTAVGTLGWLVFSSSATSGDITGLRPRITSNATSGTGPNVRGTYSEAICGASKKAALLQGVLATASVAAGNCTTTDVHVLAGHFSTGAGAVITNDLYVGMLRAQTRGDETISGNDVLLGLVNEAVGGAGRQMDSAIRIFATNVTTPTAFNYGIDMSGAAGEIGTADILLSSGAAIMTGAGVPTASCAEGSIYLRTDGADEDEVIYTCNPADTWNAADL